MEVQLRRVVYFEHRPTKFEVDAAVKAPRNTRYVCGGRIASFGRSLSVMEELHDVHRPEDKIEDEINNSQARTEDPEKEDESTTAIDNLDDEFHKADQEQHQAKKDDLEEDEFSDSDQEQPLCKKSKYFEIESDEEVENIDPLDSAAGLRLHFMSDVRSEPVESQPSDLKGPFTFCGQFETGHKCRICSVRCCNFCNSVEIVEDMSEIVCPDCSSKNETNDFGVKKGGEGQPSSAKTGQIPLPLHRKGRGRPRKEMGPKMKASRARGRPRKEVMEDTEDPKEIKEADHENEKEDNVDQNANAILAGEVGLTEFRILGNRNNFTKMFVSEAFTCDDSMEAHLYDVLRGYWDSLAMLLLWRIKAEPNVLPYDC